MLKKLDGNDAISFVVGLSNHARCGTVAIREFHCGIDIDNGARYYEREYANQDYTSLMWTILNYMPTKSTVAEYFSAEIDSDGLMVYFYIHTDIDDCESRGTRFEFVYS
jgi:hypothetical protein